MKVGVPTEIKTDEYRVALTPSGVRELTQHGHEVLVQQGAGEGSAITDEEYVAQGAQIVADADAVFAQAEMIVKVKEPQPVEVARLRPGQLLFTYLHLAPDAELTQGLVASGATCVAYETVEDSQRAAAAARADERDRGQDRHAGRRLHAREAARRARPAARRRARRRGGQGDGHRRRRRRPERGARSRSAWAPRSTSTTATSTACATSRYLLNWPRLDVLRLDARDRAAPAGDRPRDRRGARQGRQGAARDHARAARADEAQRGARRRLDRPGRLLRDLARHDALRPDLRGRRDHALLRGEHAGRGADHEHLGADQRDDALRAEARRQGRARRARRAIAGFLKGLNVAAGRVTYAPVAEDQGLEYTAPAEALALAPALA